MSIVIPPSTPDICQRIIRRAQDDIPIVEQLCRAISLSRAILAIALVAFFAMRALIGGHQLNTLSALPLIPSAIPCVQARTTLAMPVFLDAEIVISQCMSAPTVSPQFAAPIANDRRPRGVLLASYGFKVSRVYTSRVPTKMVQFQSVGNRGDQQLVSEAVRANTPRAIVVVEHDHAISLHGLAWPVPALVGDAVKLLEQQPEIEWLHRRSA